MDGENQPGNGSSSDGDNLDFQHDEQLPIVSKNHFTELQGLLTHGNGNFQSSPLHVAPHWPSPYSFDVQASFGENSSNTAGPPAGVGQHGAVSMTPDQHSSNLSTLFGNLSLNTSGSPAGVGQHGSLPATPDLQSTHLHGISALSGNDSAPSSARDSQTGELSRGFGAIPKTKSSRKSGGSVPYRKCPKNRMDFCETGEKSSSMECSQTPSRPGPSFQVPSTSFAGSSDGASVTPLNYNPIGTGSSDLLNMDDLLQNFRALSVSYHDKCSTRNFTSGAGCASRPNQMVVSTDRVFEAFGRILRTIASLLGYCSLEKALQIITSNEQKPITLLWALYIQLDAMRGLPEAAQYLNVVGHFSSELNRILELIKHLEPDMRRFFKCYRFGVFNKAWEILGILVGAIKEFMDLLVSVLSTFGTHFMSS